jgi:hypothetical protein
MKRLLTGALALFLSLAASATTLNPVGLLNPTGSTSGQAVVSTGASTAPAWGNVAATALAAQAANTVVANVTASSASPTAFAMPSCSTSASALNWTSGTGFTCNTSINAATLGGATFAAPGPIGSTTASTGAFTTLAASSTVSGAGFTTLLSPYALLANPVFSGASGVTVSQAGNAQVQLNATAQSVSIFNNSTAGNFGFFNNTSAHNTLLFSETTDNATFFGSITPSQTGGIVGTTTNNNANVGSVGEYVNSTITSGSPVSLTSATSANITSISLTAGDWDVWGQVVPVPAGGTTITQTRGAIATTSAAIGAYGDVGSSLLSATQPIASASILTIVPMRLSLSGTTTVFLVGQAIFTGSTCTAFGFISARRRR